MAIVVLARVFKENSVARRMTAMQISDLRCNGCGL